MSLRTIWSSPLLTTFTNTTFLFLCVMILIQSVSGPVLVKRLLRSRLVLAILILGSAVSMGSRMLVGYLGPGDIFQEFLGATELAAGRSMNPANEAVVHDRVVYWFGRDPLDPGPQIWAPLRTLRTNSMSSGAAQIIVQAHPPFHVLLMAPLALLRSVRFMYIMMTLINFASYGLLLLMIWRLLPDGLRASTGIVLPLVLALGWQPFVANLRQGQIGIVVALLVVAGWLNLGKRPELGGALIGVGALIKMFPALLLVWLLFRNRRAFLSSLCTIFLGALVLYLTSGWAGFVDYTQAAKTVEAVYGRSRMNYSLSAVIGHVVAGPNARSLWISAAILAVEAIILGLAVFEILRTPKASRNATALEFGGFVVLSCLLSPTCWAFYYPLLLLPLALLLGEVSTRATARSVIGLLLILCSFSFPEQVVGQLTEHIAPLIGDRPSWLLCSFPTFGMLALWLWIEQQRVRCTATTAR